VGHTTLFTGTSQNGRRGAEAALNGFGHVLNHIEAQKHLSLTYDHGRKMAAHQRLPRATGVKVYFADPYSPGNVVSTKTPTACYAGICPRSHHPR